MPDYRMMGSGIYSYWFSTQDEIHAYCMTCKYVTKTYNVCRDDYGDYSVECKKCKDWIDIWKDTNDDE